jgi:hypothetical protein
MVHLRRAAVVLMVATTVIAVSGSLASESFAAANTHKKHKKHKKKKKKKQQQQPTAGTWDSTISLSLPTSTHFEGTVGSRFGPCWYQRYVTVFYTDPSSGQVLPLSVQRTDGAGRFAFDLPRPAFPGSYQAQVAEERIVAQQASQTCLAAQSASLTVSG